MKFIYADSIDQVDPNYNFARDQHGPGRKPYWSDQYAHEYFQRPPYDGVLVSRAIVGDHLYKGKYSDAHAIRFRREGARAFLRMLSSKFSSMPIYGDCGAFSYVKEEVPPYSPDDMAAFYADGNFTHGCSVDHVIFGYRPEDRGLEGASEDERRRFDITLENASVFLKVTKKMPNFTPLGVVQGWSPDSMAAAAQQLEKMGYGYLAIGGMVPLTVDEIKLALTTIRSQIKASTKLHILGFAKADRIGDFRGFGIESFDSTSPLYQAFMDAKNNYYVQRGNGELDYFTAVRIPLATDDKALAAAAQEGRVNQEHVVRLERNALTALRQFDRGEIATGSAVDAVMEYQRLYLTVKTKSGKNVNKLITSTEASVRRTLDAAPWKSCSCRACTQAGIDVLIFRSSNRNKRRGFHNLNVYFDHLSRVLHGNQKDPIRRPARAARV